MNSKQGRISNGSAMFELLVISFGDDLKVRIGGSREGYKGQIEQYAFFSILKGVINSNIHVYIICKKVLLLRCIVTSRSILHPSKIKILHLFRKDTKGYPGSAHQQIRQFSLDQNNRTCEVMNKG